MGERPTCVAAAIAACMAEPNMALVMRPVLDLPSSTCAKPCAAELGPPAGVPNSAGCGGERVPGPAPAAAAL